MSRPECGIAAIALGSNLDDPAEQIRRAFLDIGQLPQTRVLACSPLYRSIAVGSQGEPVEQPDFCNAAMLVETSLGSRKLLSALHEIEQTHGRQQQQRWSPRTLDLDLLTYADEIRVEQGMIIPHPRIAERNFVLYPLRDIAPELLIPGLGRVTDLAARLDSRGLQPWQG